MTKRIIILCPSIRKTGGVANYYQIFNEKQSINADFFFNENLAGKNIFLIPFCYLWQYISFLCKVWKYDMLLINPSMSKVCLLRDSLYIRIARIFHLKIIVFWRGFNDECFDKELRIKYIKLLNSTFFKVNHTIVLGNRIFEKLYEIGLRTTYSIETTIISEDFILQQKKKFDYNNITLLFLARMQKSKGIYEAIQIFFNLKRRYPTLKMKVCGNGNILSQVRAYTVELGLHDIDFLGNVSGKEKLNAYRLSDIYLFPSYYEGMPNSVLEAMGMGLAIVCSAVGGLPDFFIQNKMGYMIDEINVNKYSSAIELLIEQKKLQDISDFNINYARENFLDNIVIKRLENIILKTSFTSI